MQSQELDSILTGVQKDSKRLSLVQKLLIDLTQREDAQDRAADNASPTYMPRPPPIVKDGNNARETTEMMRKINNLLDERAQLANQL